MGLVRGLRIQQVPAWDRVKPRGFARRWASVTNPLTFVAIGMKSDQIIGSPTMSFISRKERKDRRANNSFKPTPYRGHGLCACDTLAHRLATLGAA